MVPRSASLWNSAALRLRPRLRAHADVYHRYFEHSRRDPFRAHARQRRLLARVTLGAALMQGASSASLGIRTVFESSLGHRRPPPSIGEALLKSLLRFSYSCELELGTARLLEHKLVARKCHQVNCRRERSLDFDSTLVAELISAADLSDLY